jgi:protein O-mannosyl-transferase
MTRRRAAPRSTRDPKVPPAGRHAPWLALAAILLATFVVYLPSLGNGFTNWDDPHYVTDNPVVLRPTLHAVLTTPVVGAHTPLTTATLALDHRLWGLRPGPYHRVNLLLHLANTALVFAFVRALSRGRFWTTVATSLFFGIHPMHVESVAWITERKDVLYAFFYLLGLLAYLRHLDRRRWPWLLASFAAFVLALASKPTAMVFPLALLLLDWFMRRTDRLRLALEKLPFLAASVAIGWFDIQAQTADSALHPAGMWSPFDHALFAAYGLWAYVVRLFAPFGLAAIHPYPRGRAAIGPEFYGALVALVVAAPALLYMGRRLRPVLFGVAFFVVHIVLVLQLFSFGQAIISERYTYLAYVGLLFALAWWLDERPRPRTAAASTRLAIAGVLLALVPVSLVQTWARCHVWKDSVTLWSDTVARYPHRIELAYNNLGLAAADEGRLEEALVQYREALRIRGSYGEAHTNLGSALLALGRLDEAVAECRAALREDPRDIHARNDLASALAAGGRLAEAVAEYRVALRDAPGDGRTHYNLGATLVAAGSLADGITELREAVRLAPDLADAHNNLGVALMRMERYAEAVPELRRALELDPANERARANLAMALEQAGPGTGAEPAGSR